MREPDKIRLDELWATLSDTYLASWKALESFDPDRDRWTEPADFGTKEQRIEAALAAIRRCDVNRLREESHTLAREVGEDLDRFFSSLSHLQASGISTPEIKGFAAHLRDRGLYFGEKSVAIARQALGD